MGKALNAVGKLRQHKAASIYRQFAADHFRLLLKTLEKRDCYWAYTCEMYESNPLGDAEDRPCAARCIVLKTIEEDAIKTLEEK